MADDQQKLNDIAVHNIMRTEEGRDFIMRHLMSCGVFTSTFDKDQVKQTYNEGQRDAGLRLVNEIKSATPAFYIKMIGENLDG